jgi:hypothetical protein
VLSAEKVTRSYTHSNTVAQSCRPRMLSSAIGLAAVRAGCESLRFQVIYIGYVVGLEIPILCCKVVLCDRDQIVLSCKDSLTRSTIQSSTAQRKARAQKRCVIAGVTRDAPKRLCKGVLFGEPV